MHVGRLVSRVQNAQAKDGSLVMRYVLEALLVNQIDMKLPKGTPEILDLREHFVLHQGLSLLTGSNRQSSILMNSYTPITQVILSDLQRVVPKRVYADTLCCASIKSSFALLATHTKLQPRFLVNSQFIFHLDQSA